MCLGNSEPGVESRRLLPLGGHRVGETGRGGHDRPRHLYAPAKVAKPALRLPFLCFAGVVGQPARDLEEAELPRRGRNLLRVLAFVRAAERDPRLEARPRRGRAGSRPSRASVSARGEGAASGRESLAPSRYSEPPIFQVYSGWMLKARATDSGSSQWGQAGYCRTARACSLVSLNPLMVGRPATVARLTSHQVPWDIGRVLG